MAERSSHSEQPDFMDPFMDPLGGYWTDDEPPHLFDRTVALWGRDAQLDMVSEECGELLSVLNKVRRGRASRADLASEIADVKIMLEQLEHICDVHGQVREMEHRKLIRLRKRVEEGEAKNA